MAFNRFHGILSCIYNINNNILNLYSLLEASIALSLKVNRLSLKSIDILEEGNLFGCNYFNPELPSNDPDVSHCECGSKLSKYLFSNLDMLLNCWTTCILQSLAIEFIFNKL
jgi:hypothetical protein